MEERGQAAIVAVATLGDRQRRRLYDAVRAARRPLSREEAAEAVDISRKLAAFHLDKLVAAGLLEVVTAASSAPRRVGRAPKRYRPVPDTVTVNLPARSYRELATILALAATSRDPGETDEQARHRVARDRGSALGTNLAVTQRGRRAHPEAALSTVAAALDEQGFEPYPARRGCLRLANCPFHPVTDCAPELVCGVNVAYLGGLLDGMGIDTVSAAFAPSPDECCVELRAHSVEDLVVP